MICINTTIPVLFSFSSSLLFPPTSDHAQRPLLLVLSLSDVKPVVALPSTLSPFIVLKIESVSSDELLVVADL